jgi:hypothetical protein
MPFTFFAHQLPVLPLKWARPRWFDGTALCVGSMAPDFAYALEGTPLAFKSHHIASQLCFSVPVSWLIARYFRTRLAAPLGTQLPGALGAELAAVARSRHAWWTTCLSGFLGGLSHLFMDGFTHRHGWMVQHSAHLQANLGSFQGSPLPVWQALQYLGHSVGTLLGFLLLAALVQQRSFSRWNGLPPAQPSTHFDARALVWRVSAMGIVVALAAAASGHNLPTAIIRGALALFAWLAMVVPPISKSSNTTTTSTLHRAQ